MNYINSTAEVHSPNASSDLEALQQVTHLGIGAHQDDLEFMAFHGILQCYKKSDQWFGGVTCTNGAGSARTGIFAGHSDQEMQAVRKKEQNEAADLGDYSTMIQLDYPSSIIKDPSDHSLSDDLLNILKTAQPEVIYTHNPADKHDTHIAVLTETIHALRQLPAASRPKQVIGCEVWRGLDWMLDADKIPMDVSGNDELAEQLNGIFASQIAGGKRYDLATIGRRRANATFFESHGVDETDHIWFGIDLTPLIKDDHLDLWTYVNQFIDRFANDVQNKIKTQLGQ